MPRPRRLLHGSPFPSSPAAAAAAPRPPSRIRGARLRAGRETASTDNATRLVITSGQKAGAEFPLGRDEITIGRSSDSAIIIRDDYTSTHHARLMLWNGRWMLQDLDSTNGTFLNGSPSDRADPHPARSHRQGRSDDVRAAAVAMAVKRARRSRVGRVRSNNQDSGYAGRNLSSARHGRPRRR